MTERRTLWEVVRPLVYIGWAIVVVRFAMDWIAPDAARYVGVYYGMPAVLVVLSVQKHFDGVGFRRLMLAILLVVALVWVVPNCFTYTVAQFMEWTHGRFRPPDGRFGVADTAIGKVGNGLMLGALTGVVGTIWMSGWAFVAVWVPSKFRGRT